MLKDHSFKISHLLFDTFLAVFLQSVRSLEVRIHFLVVVQKEQGSCASSLLPLLASRLEKVSLESCSPQKCERSRGSRIFPTNLRSVSQLSVTHHQFCKQSPSIYLQSLAKNRIHMNNVLGLLTKYNFVFGCILNKTLATVFTSLTFNEAEILQKGEQQRGFSISIRKQKLYIWMVCKISKCKPYNHMVVSKYNLKIA